LQVTKDDFARYPDERKDGSSPGLNRGLPFDSSMKPMPMLSGNRRMRPPAVTKDSDKFVASMSYFTNPPLGISDQ
jgi:hypothetical protein